MNCTEFCPRGISPTYSIAGLKRAMISRALGRKVMTAILFIAQRVSAAVLAFFVTVHLATILYAVRGGLPPARCWPARATTLVLRLLCPVRAGGLGARADRASQRVARMDAVAGPLARHRAGAVCALLLVLGFRAAAAVYLPPEVLLG